MKKPVAFESVQAFIDYYGVWPVVQAMARDQRYSGNDPKDAMMRAVGWASHKSAPHVRISSIEAMYVVHFSKHPFRPCEPVELAK